MTTTTSSTLCDLPAQKLVDLLKSRQCSSREIVASCLARIATLEPNLHAFVEIDEDGALRRAKEIDDHDRVPPLYGLPVAVKETVDVAGLTCSLGTEIHKSRRPTRDATVVKRLREAGAIIIGTTVSTEYAIARAGPTTNPYDPLRTPGGSSSGSAAAVAARMVPIGVGTQTVGSIVRPSVYCGIFGLKPTKDVISTEGVMVLSPALDHVGPMCRTAEDTALALMSMLEPVQYNSRSLHQTKLPERALRIEGPMPELIEPASRTALDRAQERLEASGIRFEEAKLSASFTHVVSCYETILFRDIARNHGQDRDICGERMSQRMRDIIDAGRAVSDRSYHEALAEARRYREELSALLAEEAIILAPATNGVAPIVSEGTGPSRLQGQWSLVGFPALAVPCGLVDGLPVGVQLVANRGRDALVLDAGTLFVADAPGELSVR
ncbi:MAG TPA: amidase [Casimicrobiaceae bacterium]|nr:amidase [Casimicrobiaceae bacterium]